MPSILGRLRPVSVHANDLRRSLVGAASTRATAAMTRACSPVRPRQDADVASTSPALPGPVAGASPSAPFGRHRAASRPAWSASLVSASASAGTGRLGHFLRPCPIRARPAGYASGRAAALGGLASAAAARMRGPQIRYRKLGRVDPSVPADQRDHVFAACRRLTDQCRQQLRATDHLAGASGALVYVTQPAVTLTLTNTNGLHWLALHRDTSSAVAGWTRRSGQSSS